MGKFLPPGAAVSSRDNIHKLTQHSAWHQIATQQILVVVICKMRICVSPVLVQPDLAQRLNTRAQKCLLNRIETPGPSSADSLWLETASTPPPTRTGPSWVWCWPRRAEIPPLNVSSMTIYLFWSRLYAQHLTQCQAPSRLPINIY